MRPRSFRSLKTALAGGAGDADAQDSTSSPDSLPRSQGEFAFRGEVAGGWEILSARVQRTARKHMHEGETILFCLRGDWSHSLLAFEDRVLVVKPGIMAGTAFGALTATFYYQDITGIEVNTGLVTAVIEISTPSYQATARRSWVQVGSLNDHDRDPYRVSNCLPIYRRSLAKYEPYVAQLREKIREAKNVPEIKASGGFASELEKLANLHATGALSDDEFSRAKAALLGK